MTDCACAGTYGCGCETPPAEEWSSLGCWISSEASLWADIKPFFPSSLHGCWQHCKTVPWASVVVGVRGQQGRRRQLVLLLGSISSAPSTAATTLSSTLICNGKSKSDWGLSAGRGWRGWGKESRQSLLSPTATTLQMHRLGRIFLPRIHIAV